MGASPAGRGAVTRSGRSQPLALAHDFGDAVQLDLGGEGGDGGECAQVAERADGFALLWRSEQTCHALASDDIRAMRAWNLSDWAALSAAASSGHSSVCSCRYGGWTAPQWARRSPMRRPLGRSWASPWGLLPRSG